MITYLKSTSYSIESKKGDRYWLRYLNSEQLSYQICIRRARVQPILYTYPRAKAYLITGSTLTFSTNKTS